MTEIEVIKTKPLEKQEGYAQSLEEIKVIYNNLQRDTDIRGNYFDEFVRLESDYIEREAAATKPDIEFLLLRKIMDYDNVIPIVKTFYQPLLNVEEISKVVNMQESTLMPIYTGGRSSKGPPDRTIVHTVDVRVNRIKSIMFLKDIDKAEPVMYQASPGQSIDVCGFVLLKQAALFDYYLQKVPGNMDIRGRILSGAYSAQYVHYQFTQPCDNEHRFDVITSGEKSSRVLFADDHHAKLVSGAIFDYLVYMRFERAYVKPNELALLALTQPPVADAPAKEKFSQDYAFLSNLNISLTLDELSPIERVSLYKQPKFSPALLAFMTTVAQHYPVNFSEMFRSSPWEDIRSLKITNLFERVYYASATGSASAIRKVSEEVELHMQKQDMRNALLISEAKANIHYLTQSLEELRYRWIYILRFGQDKLESVLSKLPVYDMTKVNKLRLFGSIMNHISAKEASLIKKENARLVAQADAIKAAEADMPWAVIYRKLRHTTNIRKREELFAELRKYLPKNYRSVRNDWILSDKGFPIICPHVIELLEQRINRATDSQIQKALSAYADDVPIYQAYYCKICGEKLYSPEEMESSVSFEGDAPVTLHNADEDLKDWMWKIVSYIVRNNIEFTELTSDKAKNRFISNVVDKLYEIIYLIEKRLTAVKTNTQQIIDNKKKVFTSIYTWAILIKIVTENKSKLRFTSAKPLNRPKDMFSYAKSRLMNSLDVVFNNIPDMELTEKFLDNSLQKSYQSLATYLQKTTIRDVESFDVLEALQQDSVYQYIAYGRGIEKLAREKSSATVSQVEAIMNKARTPEVAIGKTSAELQNPKGPPILKDLALIKLPPAPASSEQSPFARFISVQAGAHAQITADSMTYFMEYLKGRTYLESGYVVDITKTGDSFNIVTVPKDSQKELEKRGEPILNMERLFWAMNKYFYSRAYALSPYVKNRRYADTVGVNSLALVYGFDVNSGPDTKSFTGDVKTAHAQAKKQFHKHKWGILVYIDTAVYQPEKRIQDYKTGNVHIMFAKDAGKFMHTGYESSAFFSKYQFAGDYCSICFYSSDRAEADIKDINKYADRHDEMINFYRYFEFQCPTPSKNQQARGEQSHEYRSDKTPLDLTRKCVNCGFQKTYAINDDLAYYKKYRANYVKERKIEQKTSVAATISTTTATPALTISPAVRSWKPQQASTAVNSLVDATFDVITTGSKPMKINKREYLNLVNNLGLFERVEYEDILKGKESPYKEITNELAEARANRLGALIRELIFKYTALTHYANITKPNQTLKELMDSAKPGDLEALSKWRDSDSLTSLNMNYYRAYEQMYKRADGDEGDDDDWELIAAFQLWYLCSFLLDINKMSGKLDRAFGSNLILYFLNSVFSAEKIFSAAKAARRAALEATQKVDRVNDANLVDNRQSRMFDDLVDDEYQDRFGFDDVDYDGSNDDINT